MHTFQKTFDTLKRYMMELKNEMSLLKTDLDRAIEQTCGPLGTFGKYQNTTVKHKLSIVFKINQRNMYSK